VPIFFVTTGLLYDLHALLSSRLALLQLPLFLGLFLLVRGLPALLVRHELDVPTRFALALMSATQLPLVVAIADIGLRSGKLQPETAASLVGAGMASVLLFPIAALALRKRYPQQPTLVPPEPTGKMPVVCSQRDISPTAAFP
jgi:Kef-type K+ transport system membrane component KefB